MLTAQSCLAPSRPVSPHWGAPPRPPTLGGADRPRAASRGPQAARYQARPIPRSAFRVPHSIGSPKVGGRGGAAPPRLGWGDGGGEGGAAAERRAADRAQQRAANRRATAQQGRRRRLRLRRLPPPRAGRDRAVRIRRPGLALHQDLQRLRPRRPDDARRGARPRAGRRVPGADHPPAPRALGLRRAARRRLHPPQLAILRPLRRDGAGDRLPARLDRPRQLQRRRELDLQRLRADGLAGAADRRQERAQGRDRARAAAGRLGRRRAGGDHAGDQPGDRLALRRPGARLGSAGALDLAGGAGPSDAGRGLAAAAEQPARRPLLPGGCLRPQTGPGRLRGRHLHRAVPVPQPRAAGAAVLHPGALPPPGAAGRRRQRGAGRDLRPGAEAAAPARAAALRGDLLRRARPDALPGGRGVPAGRRDRPAPADLVPAL